MNRVYALSTTIGGGDLPWSPSKLGSFSNVVSLVVANVFVLAGVIAFVLIILGGFGIILGANSGDPKKMEQSKQTLTMAVVGLVVIFFSFWIVQLIGLILGFDLLKLNN